MKAGGGRRRRKMERCEGGRNRVEEDKLPPLWVCWMRVLMGNGGK